MRLATTGSLGRVRRATLLLSFGLLMSACATSPISLSATFAEGTVYRYTLDSESSTTFVGATGTRRFTATLQATSEITIESVTVDATVISIAMTPVAATRDGATSDLPLPQTVRVEIAPDGALRRVLDVDDQSVIDAFTASDLAGIFGPVLPTDPQHLGSRWQTIDDVADYRGRVVSLRRTEGIDCVVLALQASRHVERRRTLDGRPLTLEGLERTSTRMDRALDGGYPVASETTAEAELQVRSGTLVGGDVTITATTRLRWLP